MPVYYDMLSALVFNLPKNSTLSNSSPSYYYEGICPETGELLKLPRTPLVEAIAHNFMQYLASDEVYSREGKMYGILLIEIADGEQRILKAFSGLLNGCSVVAGWVPPIPGRDEVAVDEARTLADLDTIKQELITLKQLPARQQYENLSHEFEQRLQQMSDRHQHRKQQRHTQRQVIGETLTGEAGEALTTALEQLEAESRRDGIERRKLKRQRDELLQPLKEIINTADIRVRELKQQRKELSRQLQAQMHAAYFVMNFFGQSRSLQQLIPEGLPTGTGDCCAPKLLHYAAMHNLKPLAMAEFWWGPSQYASDKTNRSTLNPVETRHGASLHAQNYDEKALTEPYGGPSSMNQDKIQGEFYGACVERCQPLMGFLLSGLQSNLCREEGDIPIQYCSDKTNLLTFKPCRDAPWRVSTEQNYDEKFLTEPYWVPILYEDKWLIVVNKPPGLLSVPGRYRDTQDSVLSRLRYLLPDGITLTAVHRLDQQTSGILLLARDRQTDRQLSQQFQQRQVHKIYEAVLAGTVTTNQGVIELPLWGDPQNRPYQQVNWLYGKPSVTKYQVIGKQANYTRVEFIPLTGRTHQLRVHAADSRGLGIPILGDRLYECSAEASRLHLHARELSFEHPQLGERLHLQTKTPF